MHPTALERLRGTTSDAIVSNVDVGPSMIELAAGSDAVPSAMDGASWAGLLGVSLGSRTGTSQSRSEPFKEAKYAHALAARRQYQLIEYW